MEGRRGDIGAALTTRSGEAGKTIYGGQGQDGDGDLGDYPT
jgi:hypothetical protein